MKIVIAGGFHVEEKGRKSSGYTISVEGNTDIKETPEDVAAAYLTVMDCLSEEETESKEEEA